MSCHSPLPARSGFTRRTLLAASAAGLSVLVVGCTAEPADPREQVTSEQADELAAQVAVQEALVAAFAAAGAADPALASAVAEQATQAQAQLDRLKAAAPGASASAASSSAARPGGTRGQGVAAHAGRRHGGVARDRLPGPVGRPRRAAGLDRRGPARPGRGAGVRRTDRGR